MTAIDLVVFYGLNISGMRQRRGASAYRTVSKSTVPVIPVVREQEPRGMWTARLVPEIQKWMERKQWEVGYYLTLLLSWNGYSHRRPTALV